MNINPAQVKADSERLILAAGGRICDTLPRLDVTEARDLHALIGRSLVMNAMLNIHFQAPIPIIKNWISENGVEQYLCESERAILAKTNAALTEQDSINLYWYIEALWAFMWAGSLIDELPFDHPVEDYMATLVPNLQKNEDGSRFRDGMKLRPYEDVFRMLDLYYRVHWWTRDGKLNNYATGDASLDIIMERRKALEWLMDAESDWDHVEMST